MMRKDVLFTSCFAALPLCMVSAASEQKPNIILSFVMIWAMVIWDVMDNNTLVLPI